MEDIFEEIMKERREVFSPELIWKLRLTPDRLDQILNTWKAEILDVINTYNEDIEEGKIMFDDEESLLLWIKTAESRRDNAISFIRESFLSSWRSF